MDTEVFEVPAAAKITEHAAKRYAQRVLGIKFPHSADFKRAKRELKSISETGFFVLVANSRGSDFWSTGDGIILCVRNGVITTVYSKEIVLRHHWQQPEDLEILLELVS